MPGRVVNNHQEKLVKLLDLFVEHVHNKFNKYAFYFFLCELLNIVITVCMVKAQNTLLTMTINLKMTLGQAPNHVHN